MSVRSRRAELSQLLRRWRWNSDNGAAMVLAFAALATAWSSYQASVWNGVQASSYIQSLVYRAQASRANEDAARSRLVDAALFTRWLEATLDDKPRLVSIYESHFRPGFRTAFEAWLRDDAALTNETTPFDRPEYTSAKMSEAARLEAEASRDLGAGGRANAISDTYFSVTVILALALFFAGALRPLVKPSLRNAVLAFALFLCAWAVTRLITTPVAR